MDLEVVKTWLTVINMIGTFGIGVWLYLEKRSDKTNLRIDVVEASLKVHGEQLAHLEAKADGAPTHDDLSELHEKVNKVGEGVKELTGEFKGVRNLLNTIHQHLLNGGKP
jgi:archaellum component FlaC